MMASLNIPQTSCHRCLLPLANKCCIILPYCCSTWCSFAKWQCQTHADTYLFSHSICLYSFAQLFIWFIHAMQLSQLPLCWCICNLQLCKYHVILYCMVLYYMVLYRITWYCIVWYSMVCHTILYHTRYGIVWYCIVWYGMVLHGIAWYCMVWCRIVSYWVFVSYAKRAQMHCNVITSHTWFGSSVCQQASLCLRYCLIAVWSERFPSKFPLNFVDLTKHGKWSDKSMSALSSADDCSRALAQSAMFLSASSTGLAFIKSSHRYF